MSSRKARGTRGVESEQQVGCGRFPKTEEAPPSNGGAGPQMFGLKSYAFDLSFTKRPAAVFTKSGKVFSISGICNVAIAESEFGVRNPRFEI
jgi:hypothetical protein